MRQTQEAYLAKQVFRGLEATGGIGTIRSLCRSLPTKNPKDIYDALDWLKEAGWIDELFGPRCRLYWATQSVLEKCR